MSYFQSFHFSIFSFPEAFFSQNAAFPEFCTLERLISKVFIFSFLASQKLFFAKRCISGVLHSGMSYFQSFHFSIFSFPEAFFSQNAAFPRFCALECLISKVFIFRVFLSLKFFFLNFPFSTFIFPQTFFSAKRCISRVLHSGMSYFQNFHFSIFSLPEAIFLQNAAFPEFCTLECLISKVFIFRFLASQKLFFRKTLHFRSSALWNVLFPMFSFFDF